MQYALVNDMKVIAEPDERGICPLCEEIVIARCGEVNVWHWAHKAASDCDSFSEGETPWHLAWKDAVSPECCEVIIEREGKKHRADILTKEGAVLEIQHSSISSKNINLREDFYGNMMWLLDYTWNWPNFEFYDIEGRKARFRWIRPRRSFYVAQAPLYIHLGENLNLLGYREELSWKEYHDLETGQRRLTTTGRKLINSPLPEHDWIFRIILLEEGSGIGVFLTTEQFKEMFLVLKEKEKDADDIIQTRLG